MTVSEKIQKQLFEIQDIKYKNFHSQLIPNIAPDTIIGVRTPQLRRYAKALFKTDDAEEFMNILPHKYYEENNLHAFLTESIRDYEQAIQHIDKFLPYIDNWATCDCMSPSIFKKYPDELYEKIKEWINSTHKYTVRFGVRMLMKYFLDDKFTLEASELVAGIESEEYYINMARAWYFATALAKQYDTIIKYLEQRRMDIQTHNKTIQKAIESYRITDEQKAYLRTLKAK